MKKHVFGRKFKRDSNERKALFRGLMSDLVVHESIKTTEEKAKSIKSSFDKLITTAKKGGQQAFRALEAEVSIPAARKLVDDIAVRTATRQGGYTRIIKLGQRFNDNAMVVMMELVDKRQPLVVDKAAKKDAKTTKTESVESTAAVETKAAPKTKKAVKPATKKKTPVKKTTKKGETN